MNRSTHNIGCGLQEAALASVSPAALAWSFRIPVDVANQGLQIAIFGQDPDTSIWMYWDAVLSSYVPFSTTTSGASTACLINATPSKGSYSADTIYDVNLPLTQQINSGVVAMFIGGSTGIPVQSGVPASPTTSTNPDDLYSLFEFTYSVPPPGPGSPTEPILDIDISNVDQVGFTYTVHSSTAPFPLSEVGSSVPQQTVFDRFAAAFPEGTPFNECLIYGRETIGGTPTQLRILAPQDVLEDIKTPNVPSYLNPTCAPKVDEPFAANTYFYSASETSSTGETAMNPGVFGGFLLNSSGDPQALGIDIGWLGDGGVPAEYVPVNPSATGINIYRAQGPATNAGDDPPKQPTTGYTLRKGMSIKDWNNRPGFVFFDDSTNAHTQEPQQSSYGFSALSTWFDEPLQDFFDHYASDTFSLFQFNQNNNSNGTLWTGKVVDVKPAAGQAITTQNYVDENGAAQSIDTVWTWGDGSETYKVLQLVGNAYNSGDLSAVSQVGQTGLSQGEFQGAVLNVYFPYFTGNTGLESIVLSGGTTWPLPQAPAWMLNSANGPSQMVFGCAGVFATPKDPDAVAQEASFPGLAVRSLTNIQNVVVSAFNRGIATGYDFAVQPQQYTSLFGFSKAPVAAPKTGAVPAGTYTYFLSGTLNDGRETALSWPQTITLSHDSTVTLVWLPQEPALYKQANVYRQDGTDVIKLVGTIANTSGSQATTFVDENQAVAQPSNGAPFVFYPSWDDSSNAGFVPSNLFSAFLHQNLSADPQDGISINGLVYGYPFDDQGDFSTNINYGTDIPDYVWFQISPLS